MNFERLLSEYALSLDDLSEAFLHSSFAHVNGLESNERLEFMGDSLVNLFVTFLLFERHKDYNEGQMSKLRSNIVSTKSLSKIFDKFGLEKYLKIGHEASDKIKANTVEAIVAKVFFDFDCNYNKTQKFVFDFIFSHTKPKNDDYKSALQELLQQNAKHKIEYETQTISKTQFISVVKNNGVVLAKGKGQSKKQAEQDCAKKALEMLCTKR